MRQFKARPTWKSTVQAIRFAATAPFWTTDGVSFAKQLLRWDQEQSSDLTTGSSVASPTGTELLTPQKPKFKEVYEVKKEIRKGSFATVWECVSRETGQMYAVKIILRQGLDPKDDEAVLNEVSMMQSVRGNKYVVQLVDFFEEPEYFYIVMEHMAGGDVFDRIVQYTRYTEKDARDLIFVLLEAVSSLHKAGMAHRDIKPQNLLLVSTDDNAAIKLADFGFARRVHTPESLTNRVGTPSYVAPEVSSAYQLLISAAKMHGFMRLTCLN